MDYQEALTKYLLSFIAGLKQGGIRKAVISSGSRSTPLSLLVNRDPDIQSFIDIDERSAGFFALGIAKGSNKPVALICTSGSAAANYYPAICEAEATNIPLVVLTTDRPAELQGVGAPQAMNQVGLYASHVKAACELSLPEPSTTMMNYSRWQGFTMTCRAQNNPQGPVHINIPLREPLLPDLTLNTPSFEGAKVIKSNREAELQPLAPLFAQKGLIIVGEERTPAEAGQLLRLAEKLNWPIIGDPLTNLATNVKQSPNFLHQADLIFCEQVPTPQVILRFGRMPVTKPVVQWLAKHDDVTTILVEDGIQFRDQLKRANYLLDMSVADFFRSFNQLSFNPVKENWLLEWQQRQRLAVNVLLANKDLTSFDHSSIVKKLMSVLKKQNLFVANSNAIRLVDRLTLPVSNDIRIFGNRGVNGIDGLNSTAAGIAVGTGRPITLLIGDLAFFHDLTGIEMFRRYKLPVTVILLNNNGGGIFSFLPQHQLPTQDFSTIFRTPQDLNFKYIADFYDFDYACPNDISSFVHHLNRSGQQIIEVNDTQESPVEVWRSLTREYHNRSGYLDERN